jgi:signal transduction histidine kinase
MAYSFEKIDLKKLIEDIVAEIGPNITKTGLKFGFNADDCEGGYMIKADKDKLKQVISNLIDNSLKYTPSGSVDVRLTCDKNTRKYHITVQDTGIGIPKEILPKLFQKFTRANNANKTNIKGTGLGLYVAKQMIEAHHGTIRAESDGEGKGSKFIVELDGGEKLS